MTETCRLCGSPLPSGAVFCAECGLATTADPPASAAAPASAPAAFAPRPGSSLADALGAPRDSEYSCPQCTAPLDPADTACPRCGFALGVSEPGPMPPAVLAGLPAPEPGSASVPPAARPSLPGSASLRRTPPPPTPGLDGPVELSASPFPPPAPAQPVIPPFEFLTGKEPAAPSSRVWVLDDADAAAPPVDSAPAAAPLAAVDLDPAPGVEEASAPAPRRSVPDPFPWGVAPIDGSDPEDLETTRLVARAAPGERFVLQFSTGESVTATGAGLVGRNPAAQPGEFVDQLIAVFDAGKSVSKTHLEFGQDGGRFWVSDRYSTNGTTVRPPNSEARRCEPGRRYFVSRGTRVDIGEQFFVVS